jgi:peptidase M49-like protein
MRLTPLLVPVALSIVALAQAGCAGRGGTTANAPAAAPTAPAATPTPAAPQLTVVPDVEARVAQFARTPLSADISALPQSETKALAEAIAAARFLDEVYLRQVWTGNPELRDRVAAYDGPHAAAAREYFAINFGPWDRLKGFEPFLSDTPHADGAGFYPEGLTKEDFGAWIAAHPGDANAFRSGFTVIRRQEGGGLTAVPYSQAYIEQLRPAAERLRAAAKATANESLRRFLRLRADAFLSDDYYASDVAWMDLDAPVEVTIGPYETYEDGLFGYKTAFEAYVTVDIPAESSKLAVYKAELPWLERNLPIPDEHKNLNRGSESPIRVVDLVYSAGDGKKAVQTVAFNLPNDERVREAKGSKKVLLHNMLRAKYEQILRPIAARTLAVDQLPHLAFEAFFNEVLHHELGHGLGPGRIKKDGKDTEARLELQELYSPIEEAKADVLGVYDILALVKRGKMPKELEDTLPATYLAGLFRSARFGVHEAHGQGVVSQFNYLQEQGAIAVDADGKFRVVTAKFPDAIKSLLNQYLMLEARGDYAGTKAFLDKYGVASPALLAAIDKLTDVPVDIRPLFPLADELAPEQP